MEISNKLNNLFYLTFLIFIQTLLNKFLSRLWYSSATFSVIINFNLIYLNKFSNQS